MNDVYAGRSPTERGEDEGDHEPEPMTLEQVRDWHREKQYGVSGFSTHRAMADAIDFHLSQPQPVAQGEAVGRVCAGDVLCNRYVDCYKKAHMDTPVDELVRLRERDRIEFALRDAGFDLDRASAIAQSATPTIPTGHRVVPVEPKLIGWRMADYTHETDSVETARNWSANVAVLPIFEGDPNTKIAASPSAGGV